MLAATDHGMPIVFIQTETTPNPATLKFLPGRTVMEDGTAYFLAPDSAGSSPLAQRLFEIEGVREVFLGPDFITVAKDDDREWYLLKPAILGVVMEQRAAQLDPDAVVGGHLEAIDARAVKMQITADMGADEILLPAGQNGALLHVVGQCLEGRPVFAIRVLQPLRQFVDAVQGCPDIAGRQSVPEGGRLDVSRCRRRRDLCPIARAGRQQEQRERQ